MSDETIEADVVSVDKITTPPSTPSVSVGIKATPSQLLRVEEAAIHRAEDAIFRLSIRIKEKRDAIRASKKRIAGLIKLYPELE